jgi:hypothetical protein
MKNEVETAVIENSKKNYNASQSISAIPFRFKYTDDEDTEKVNDVGLSVHVSSIQCVSAITRRSSILCRTDATQNSTQSVSSLLRQGNNDTIDSKLHEYMKQRPFSRIMCLFY